MLQNKRQTKAREAANGYAPKPNGSSILYGLIAVTLMGMAIIIVSIFYQADLGAFPILIAIVLALAFVGGVLLRRHRRRQHSAAYTREYARHTSDPPAAVGTGDEVYWRRRIEARLLRCAEALGKQPITC